MDDFLNVLCHGFSRVAVVIPRVTVADPAANAAAHVEALEAAYREGACYALCPELGLTGYSCGDLFHSQALLEGALRALGSILARTPEWRDMLISVGMPLVVDDAVYNCAVTIQNGSVIAVAPKSYPPEYREFYELRHFARSCEARSTEVTVHGHRVPFGTDVLVAAKDRPFVLHTEVCEDIWVAIPPSTVAALAGATVLANLSASNITIGKAEYREQLVVGSSGRNVAVQMYSAAGFGESSTDLSWDGDGYVAERGSLLARTERFSLKGASVIVDVDLESLVQDRMRQSSFHQNASDHRKPFRTVRFEHRQAYGKAADPYRTFRRAVDSHPFVPKDPRKRDERCRETFMIQATALARKLESLPPDMRKVVIGVSGGQDSTLALLVAAHAMDLLGLPRTNIVCVTMPGFGTTDRTYRNACRLIEAIGATFREISIRDLTSQTFKDVGGIEDVDAFIAEIKAGIAAGREDADTRRRRTFFENVQAWSRKHVLFSVSGWEGAMVLGTGDLSELLLGWCTMFGDHASHYGINAGVPKTLISFLIRWAAEVIYEKEPEVKAVLLDILDTEISPELLPPDEHGKIAQKTEEKIGPYELHDFFGYCTVRWGYRPSRIARMALHAFAGKYDLATVTRWLRVFLTRFVGNQFKRSCLPDGPKVGLTAVSPRGDWRMPSDATARMWLDELARNVPASIA